MTSKPLYLKPRGAARPIAWEEIAVDAPEVGPRTSLDDAQFVALDVETTGNAPFLVLEIGAERFTLASPLYIVDRGQSRASLFYDEFAPAHLAEYAMDTWRVPSVSSVPATSIFSKTDGVVRWETCVHPSGPLTENIEVYGSHCGLGFHPAAAYAILDRLAVPTDPWPKFVPPGWLAIHFPTQPDTTRHSRASRIA